jgi:hypothetical protein
VSVQCVECGPFKQQTHRLGPSLALLAAGGTAFRHATGQAVCCSALWGHALLLMLRPGKRVLGLAVLAGATH